MARSSPNEEFLITDPEKQPGVVLEVEAGGAQCFFDTTA